MLLLAKKPERVFATMIPENNAIAGSAEYVAVNTLRQKYGYQGQFERYRDLTTEILEAIA